MGIIKTIAKVICVWFVVFAILGLLFLCSDGSHDSPIVDSPVGESKFMQVCNAVESTSEPVQDLDVKDSIATPTPEPVQNPDVKDHIITKFDGQEIHVKCKSIVIPTDSGTIIIENDDIEVISVIGNGNMIAYPSTANPEIRDVGSYNEIWGSIWL